MKQVKYHTTIQGVPEVYCCRGIIEDKTACIDVVFNNAVTVEAYGNIYPNDIPWVYVEDLDDSSFWTQISFPELAGYTVHATTESYSDELVRVSFIKMFGVTEDQDENN